MAETPDGQEKSEDPTAKRTEDARKKGQVPRSKELNVVVIQLLSVLGFFVFGSDLSTGMQRMMARSMTITREEIFDPLTMLNRFTDNLADGFLLFIPMLLLLFVGAVISPGVLGGWVFSTDAVRPKASKLNPISGLKRIFGPNGAMELVKAIAKVLVVASTGVAIYISFWNDILLLNREPLLVAMNHLVSILLWGILWVSCSLILIALVDIPFQLWQHKKSQKMSKQEVKEEGKQQEGSPDIKRRIRQVQMDMAQRRMMTDVPLADVILTNPTHYAVALKYDESRSSAPIVVAKGQDLVAMEIRRLALASEVPVLSLPPLARAIYFHSEIGSEVPEGLYLVIAQILAYVYQLNEAKTNGTPSPDIPLDIEIPPAFRRD